MFCNLSERSKLQKTVCMEFPFPFSGVISCDSVSGRLFIAAHYYWIVICIRSLDVCFWPGINWWICSDTFYVSWIVSVDYGEVFERMQADFLSSRAGAILFCLQFLSSDKTSNTWLFWLMPTTKHCDLIVFVHLDSCQISALAGHDPRMATLKSWPWRGLCFSLPAAWAYEELWDHSFVVVYHHRTGSRASSCGSVAIPALEPIWKRPRTLRFLGQRCFPSHECELYYYLSIGRARQTFLTWRFFRQIQWIYRHRGCSSSDAGLQREFFPDRLPNTQEGATVASSDSLFDKVLDDGE